MKILIPYDGTRAAESALLDLQNAGFGQDDQILVVITDVFLPESAEEFFNARRMRLINLEKSGTYSYAPARRRIEEKRFLSSQVRSRLSSAFPTRNIKVETSPGFILVSSEILKKAAVWKADLIVLGSQESEAQRANNGYKSGLWRVVSEAECPVRLVCGTNRGKSAVKVIKPDDIFIEETKSSGGKQTSERRETLNDITETLWRQGKYSSGIFQPIEKSEQIPKLMTRQKQFQRQRGIKNIAAAASVSF